MHLSAFSSIQTFLSHLSANLCHSCHKSACFHIDWSYLSCRIGLISVGFNFIDLGWNSIWEIAEILGGGAAMEVQIHCSRRLLDFLQSVNLKPSKPTLMICATYCHALRPTPRAWRSFHTSNPKAYSVTWPKQILIDSNSNSNCHNLSHVDGKLFLTMIAWKCNACHKW